MNEEDLKKMISHMEICALQVYYGEIGYIKKVFRYFRKHRKESRFANRCWRHLLWIMEASRTPKRLEKNAGEISLMIHGLKGMLKVQLERIETEWSDGRKGQDKGWQRTDEYREWAREHTRESMIKSWKKRKGEE